MRTTIVIDESLLDELMQAEPRVSRSEAIRRAVQHYVRRGREATFMRLAGSGLVDLDWREAEKQDMVESRSGAPTVRRGGNRGKRH